MRVINGDMSIPHLTPDYEKLSYIATVLAAAVTVLSVLWKITKKAGKSIKDKYLFLEGSISKINEISKEFLPNHGSSLKDLLTKMQNELVKNTELTEKIATRQKWLFDNREMPIFESDEEGRCVWVNIAFMNLVKRDMNFLLGNGWKNIIAPEDRERVVNNWESCVKDGRDSEDTYSVVDINGNRTKVFTAACKTGKYGYVGAMKIIKQDEND